MNFNEFYILDEMPPMPFEQRYRWDTLKKFRTSQDEKKRKQKKKLAKITKKSKKRNRK